MQCSLPMSWGVCVIHKALKVPVYSEWTSEIMGYKIIKLGLFCLYTLPTADCLLFYGSIHVYIPALRYLKDTTLSYSENNEV